MQSLEEEREEEVEVEDTLEGDEVAKLEVEMEVMTMGDWVSRVEAEVIQRILESIDFSTVAAVTLAVCACTAGVTVGGSSILSSLGSCWTSVNSALPCTKGSCQCIPRIFVRLEEAYDNGLVSGLWDTLYFAGCYSCGNSGFHLFVLDS